ncbi:acyltransferase family protein [Corallococcus carmarthensis]|uniref:Acyltransferase n=1 Tax=Corallococcus carmarthensis TaxID=2316728 RepID=A0A3A8JVQ7_9BACT|nr:acyltransferase [Corallococcus carmarthensis]NOK23022.1 acyltransferase [Corallococcus carmarthensis]RKG94441.1 acyltransferase [Corallococcus carmarthensis]
MNAPIRSAGVHHPDLDWLRVLAIVVLHLFHTGMMFNTWEWHVKSPQALPVLEPVMSVLHLVRMPLLMVISGAGTAFALRRRTLGAFAKDRTKRLLLPLVFGMFVVVPPQIYVERLFRGQFEGSYAAFYPTVFGFVPYPAGSFSWHHLWFVAYLFVYCLLALPLFAALRTERGERFLARVDAWLSRGVNVLWLVVPLALTRVLLRDFPETHALFDDPRTFLLYGLLFLYGHLLGRCPGVWNRLVTLRHGLLALFLAALVVEWVWPWPVMPVVPAIVGGTVLIWSGLLVALAYARHHVRVSPAWLPHAQALSYPFYIFHQTVIVCVGYLCLRLPVGPWAMLLAVLTVSFTVTLALCEGVSRVAWLRPLFGMKPRSARPGVLAPEAVG